MGDVGRHVLRTLRQQCFGGVHQRAARVDDVVDQDAGLALHVADDVHHFRFTRTLAALVDDGERRIEALGQRARAYHAAHVRRDDNGAGHIEVVLDVTHHHGAGEEIVGRNVEEALDLPGVEIHGQHAVSAGAGDHVGHQLGRDRGAGPGLAVLPGIAEIRDHRGDALGGGPLQRVDDDEQFHQVVVGGERGRLHHEHVLAADVLLDLDEDFHVVEALDDRLGHRRVQVGADGLGQWPVAVACHDLHHARNPLIRPGCEAL